MPIIVPPTFDVLKLALEDPIIQAMPLRNGDRVALPEGLSYVFIIYTCRTGSYYLAELLATTGFFNKAEEDLGEGPVMQVSRARGLHSFSEYFAVLAGENAKNNVFVVKSTIDQLVALAWHGVLPRIAARSRFIVMERMDKLAQVVSWRIAVETGHYRSDGLTEPDIVPTYDGEDLRHRLNHVVYQYAQTSLFLGVNGLVPLHVGYEAMIAMPLAVARAVCRYLGHPDLVCDPAQVKLLRQATGLNKAWRARFLAEQVPP